MVGKGVRLTMKAHDAPERSRSSLSKWRWWITGASAALVVVLLLLTFVFEDWPQRTIVHRTGSVLGLEVGMSKEASFAAASDAQQESRATVLELMDEPPSTHAERFRGDPIVAGDLRRVTSSNQWYLGLPDRNAWLVIYFVDGHIDRIEEHEWTGPTL